MKRVLLILLSFLLLLPSLVSGIAITSVHPGSANVGTAITVIGGPFSMPLKVIIGGGEVVPSLIDERQLVFVVPQLDAGEHALYLISDGQKSEQTISFLVTLPSPRIDSLEPANIDECSSEDQRIVSIRGEFFRTGAQLSLGDQIVPSTRVSNSEIEFTVPPLKAGTYGAKVINPDGSESLLHSLWLNNIPHIYNVSSDGDYVSSYQLIISGKNFVHNSTLIVREHPVGQNDLPPQQRIVPVHGGPTFSGEQARLPQSEAVSYIDCNTLIYTRYPYSRQEKTLFLRVGNPDGKQTESFEISAP